MAAMKPIALTTSVTLDRDTHMGTTCLINASGGFTITLPEATGSGDVYKFYVQTTLTASATIAALTTDIMQGVAVVSTTNTAGTVGTSATSDKLVMNGSTTGGLVGSWIELEDVVDGAWKVNAGLVASGSFATPFSAT